MNIKEAKMEVEQAVKIYLEKDENGEYRVPLVRQRPLFLVGAPGIGKTAIMEQVAEDLDIALVSYSMTHHTRQSAIGLPYLKEINYGGKTYTKSEYTMSEIIASVYDVIEKTGRKEGILFLDEINCVSETLAPAMLLFLQYKRFGNQQVPEGWVVVTAGNPPQFNKSVKEFDVATQDRLKMLSIDADFGCWKEYAYNAGIHPAIMAFLESNSKWFYGIKTTVDGQQYITARGWEDLSTEIQAYERHGFPVTQELIMEYVTDKECARKFAVYYDLFKKYRVDYAISDILKGNINSGAIQKAQAAKFDERLSIISMLMEAIGTSAKSVVTETEALEHVVKKLRVIKKKSSAETPSIYELLSEEVADIKEEMDKAKQANALSSSKKSVMLREIKLFEKYKEKFMDASSEKAKEKAKEEGKKIDTSNSAMFALVKKDFQGDVKRMQKAADNCTSSMENAFKYMEAAFGDEQEMTLFVAELTVNKNIANFIAKNGSDAYYKHNKSMLVYDQDAQLSGEIDQMLDEAV